MSSKKILQSSILLFAVFLIMLVVNMVSAYKILVLGGKITANLYLEYIFYINIFFGMIISIIMFYYIKYFKNSYYNVNIIKSIFPKHIKNLEKELCDMKNEQIINALNILVKNSDVYTAGHSERVTQYAVGLGEYMGYSNEDLVTLERAAMLHDIGKIAISEVILNKRGKLTFEEYEIVKKHSSIGYDTLKEICSLKKEAEVLRYHHERVDGTGYPLGLKGEEISEMSKILSVCDSFDAMTSHRVYRNDLNFDEAIEELKNNSGTQFDSAVVNNFISYIHSNNRLKTE